MIITIIISVITVTSGAYYWLSERIAALEGQMLLVTTLPTTLHHLAEQLRVLKEISFPEQPASLLYVNQLRDENTTHLTRLDTRISQTHTALEKLTIQLQELQKIPLPAHPASIEKVVELNKELSEIITTALQTNREYDDKLDIQINDVRKMVSALLNTIKLKQEEMDKLVLPGTIIAYAGVINEKTKQLLYQARWLICDGSTLPKKKYPDLYAAITDSYGHITTIETFNIPDFRGVFLRGLDSGKQLDPNRILGSYQLDQNQAHIHRGQAKEGGLHTHKSSTDKGGAHQHRLQANGYWFTAKNLNERRAITSEVDDNQQYWTTENGVHNHTFSIEASGHHNHELNIDSSGGDESRPKNYPVTYLIRF